MIRTVALLIALSALIDSSPSILPAQEYEIRLSREAKVAERYRLSATGSHAEIMTISVGGKAVGQKGNEFSINLVSLMTVIEIDTRGRPTKYSLDIEKCLITTAGSSKPLIAPGETLLVSLEGNRYIFTVKNIPVDSSTVDPLSVVVPSHASEPSDDDVFGTRERKKVGESWPINGDLAAESLKSALKVATMKGDVRGSAKLDGVVRDRENEYLIVSALLGVNNFSMPLPNGVQIQTGQVIGSFSGRFPVNQSFEGMMARSVEREMERVK